MNSGRTSLAITRMLLRTYAKKECEEGQNKRKTDDGGSLDGWLVVLESSKGCLKFRIPVTITILILIIPCYEHFNYGTT